MVPHGTLEPSKRRADFASAVRAAPRGSRRSRRLGAHEDSRSGRGDGLARAGRSRPRSRRSSRSRRTARTRSARGFHRCASVIPRRGRAVVHHARRPPPRLRGRPRSARPAHAPPRRALDPHRHLRVPRRAVHGARARAPPARGARLDAPRADARRAVHERRDGRPRVDQPRPPPRVARGHRRARRRAGRRDARVGPRGRPRDDRGRGQGRRGGRVYPRRVPPDLNLTSPASTQSRSTSSSSSTSTGAPSPRTSSSAPRSNPPRSCPR